MSEHKFEAFPEIKKLGSAVMSVTQKIHGTNAQVFIFQQPDGTLGLLVGSRTRYITPDADNYGFATHVYAHKQEFIDKLGPGHHYGEWAGPGINSGEGLSQKMFLLFDHWKFPPERPLPPQVGVVPVLHYGKFDLSKVDEAMADLKANGSKAVPGFDRPEGVVVSIKGDRYKVVFAAEDSKWARGGSETKAPKVDSGIKFDHLLQPIRLEKLLSRDEAYLTRYPSTLALIASDYVADLIKEDQITGTEAEVKGIRKAMGKDLFAFIKESVDKQLEMQGQ